jgi:hypothetical protein
MSSCYIYNYSEYIYVVVYCYIPFLINMMNYYNDMHWYHRLVPLGNASMIPGYTEPFVRFVGSLRVGGFLPMGTRERTRRV